MNEEIINRIEYYQEKLNVKSLILTDVDINFIVNITKENVSLEEAVNRWATLEIEWILENESQNT